VRACRKWCSPRRKPRRKGWRSGVGHQPGPLSQAERVHGLALTDLGHADHRVLGELRAQHGGRREHLQEVVSQCRHPAPQQITQVRRYFLA